MASCSMVSYSWVDRSSLVMRLSGGGAGFSSLFGWVVRFDTFVVTALNPVFPTDVNLLFRSSIRGFFNKKGAKKIILTCLWLCLSSASSQKNSCPERDHPDDC